MNLENSKAQMRKGILEYCILRIIGGGEVYASDIITRMKDAHLIIVEGTLYPLLTRLKNEGLLEYKWIESQQGPPRKYYLLSESGKKFLESLHLSWQELVSSVEKINSY